MGISSYSDDSFALKQAAAAAVLVLISVLVTACAAQLPPAGTHGEAPPVAEPEARPVAEQPPQQPEPELSPGERPLKDRRGALNLVVFELAPGLQAHRGEALAALIDGHQQTLNELHQRGLRAASMRSENGSFFVILDAPTLASLEDRFKDDPILASDDFRVSAAGFGFTVGTLCENAGGGEAKQLQMLWFTRDIAVLERGGALAPTPFGTELAQLDEVVAAGAWGYGHLGFVFLDLPSPAAAEKLLVSFPVAVDPQWSYTVHTLAGTSDTFCR